MTDGMTNQTADLPAFLTARYSEAEAAARDLLRTAQRAGLAVREPRLLGREIPGWHAWPDVEAMCNRRLTDIALKRAILDLHRLKVTRRDTHPYDSRTGERIPDDYDGDCEICGWFDPEQGGCATVRQLGTEFSEHLGYKPVKWVP